MAAPSLLGWRAFWLAKQGHRDDEYEDAVAGDAAAGRFAIADGASESAFAATWARLLVEAFVARPGPWSEWLAGARSAWQQRCTAGAALPWYLEEKLAQGAAATLLGVSFSGPDRWRAAAVGDSCLFHVRGGRLERSFPLRHSTQFGNEPDLLLSRTIPGSVRCKRWNTNGTWRPGDVLLLATDALAQSLLREAEAGHGAWTACMSVDSQEQFAAAIEGRRRRGLIRNDDATLLIVSAPASEND